MPGAPTAVGARGWRWCSPGVGFDSPSLLVAGVGLVGLAVVAVVWVELARPSAARARARARRGWSRTSPTRLRIQARRRPRAAARRRARRPGPRRAGRDRAALARSARAPRSALRGRGRRRLGPARLEVRDPLGPARADGRERRRRASCWSCRGSSRSSPPGRGAGGARASSLGGLEDGAAASRLDARAIELEVDGLRAYREGSPASRIHWPAVARTGELIERRLVAGADAAPLVVLDAAAPGERRGARRRRARRRLALLSPRRRGRLRGAAAGRRGARLEIEPDLRELAPGPRAARAGRGGRAGAPAISRTVRSGAVFWVTAARPAGAAAGAARAAAPDRATWSPRRAGRPGAPPSRSPAARAGSRAPRPRRAAAAGCMTGVALGTARLRAPRAGRPRPRPRRPIRGPRALGRARRCSPRSAASRSPSGRGW